MKKWVGAVWATVAVVLISTHAEATTCTSLTTISNGTTADATPVWNNFTSLLNCANNNLAPLANPLFTGKLGIEVASPQYGLDASIQGANIGGTIGAYNTRANSTDKAGFLSVPAYNNANYPVLALAGINTSSANDLYYGGSSGSYSAATGLHFYTTASVGAVTGTERLTVVGSGNVGIGTTNPATVLDIQAVNGAPNPANATLNTGIVVAGSAGGPSINIGTFNSGGVFYSWIQSAFHNSGSSVEPLALQQNGGSVGVGTTSPQRALQVVGDIRVGTSGSNGCIENFAGTALTGSCSSDAALKDLKGMVSGVLEAFGTLQLVHFSWNATAAALYHNSPGVVSAGFLAQSVERAFPELVSRDAHGYRLLDYTTLSLYGLEAIKELKVENDRRAAEATDLKARLAQSDRQLRDQAAAILELRAEIAALQRAAPRRTAAR